MVRGNSSAALFLLVLLPELRRSVVGGGARQGVRVFGRGYQMRVCSVSSPIDTL